MLLMTQSFRAQKFLAIDQDGLFRFKRTRVYTQDVISFKREGYYKKIKDTIVGFSDSLIFLKNHEPVSVHQIRKIGLDRSNWLIRKVYKTAMVGSVYLLLIDAINNVANKNPTVVDQPFLIVCSSMMAGGLIIKFVSVKRIKIGRRSSIKIMDLSLN